MDLFENNINPFLLQAHLERANLMDTHLERANLSSAHLEGAEYLTAEQLSKTKSLFGAIVDPELLDELKQKFPKDYERSMQDDRHEMFTK